MIELGLEWAATILSLVGALFVVKKKWKGYLFWFGGNTAWLALGLLTETYGAVITFSVFNAVCIYGVWDWRFKKVRK